MKLTPYGGDWTQVRSEVPQNIFTMFFVAARATLVPHESIGQCGITGIQRSCSRTLVI